MQSSEYNFDPMTGKPIEKLPSVERRDGICMAIFALFALLTANCLYTGGLHLGFAVGGFGMLLTSLLYLRGRLRPTFLGAISLVSAVAVLCSFALHQSEGFAHIKLAFFLLALSVFLIAESGMQSPPQDDFRILLAPFYLLFGVSIPALAPTWRAFGKTRVPFSKKLGKILLGLCIALPVVLVLGVLLIWADTAFEHFIDNISLDLSEGIATLIFGSILLLVLAPILFAIRKNTVKQKTNTGKAYCSVLDSTLTGTVLGAVSFLYLLFLLTQLSYLFGGFAGLLPEDYTYADYARRGFFEMCVICVINLGLLFLTELLVQRNANGALPTATRILSVYISSFSIFLIVAAIAKMLLYIRSYGLTFLRLGTSIFMLFLFFVFAFWILHTVCRSFKHMRAILTVGCILFALTALAEPYNIIAKYNVYAYESGLHNAEDVDTHYLQYTCGAYGVQALIDLSEAEDKVLAEKARERLDDLHDKYCNRADELHFRNMSLATYRAKEALKEYYTK